MMDGMTGPIYLRDLAESMQREIVQNWRQQHNTCHNTLISSYDDGKDIIIGYALVKPKVDE